MLCRTDRVPSSLVSRFLSDTRGATAVEYGIIAFIAFAIALTVYGVGESLVPVYESLEAPLQDY